MSTTFDTEIVKQNKARLNAAFRDLRAQGILAKQNYTCCQTCGFNDLEVEAERLAQEGQKIKGGVFYHAQDTDYMRERVDSAGWRIAVSTRTRMLPLLPNMTHPYVSGGSRVKRSVDTASGSSGMDRWANGSSLISRRKRAACMVIAT